MKTSFKIVLFVCFFLACGQVRGQQYNWQWVTMGRATGINKYLTIDFGGLDTDSQGNVYTTGEVYDGLQFLPFSQIYKFPNASESNIFLTKHDRCGNIAWVKIIGTKNRDMPTEIYIDKFDDIYVSCRAGLEGDTLRIDTAKITQITNGNVLLKFNPNGHLVWHKFLPPSHFTKLVKDKQNNLYVLSQAIWGQNINIDGVQVPRVGTDMYLAKFDDNNILQWSKYFQTPEFSRPVNVCLDSLGNVYIAGNYDRHPLQIIGVGTLPQDSYHCAFVAKYNTHGVLNWINKIETPQDSELIAEMTVSKKGIIYLSVGKDGYGSVGFRPWSRYVKTLDTNGNEIWQKPTTNYTIFQFQMTDDEDIYITGRCFSSFLSVSVPLSYNNPIQNGFIAKMKKNTDWEIEWAKLLGNNENSTNEFSVVNKKTVYGFGNFVGNATFGETTLTEGILLQTYYIAKLQLNEGARRDTTICRNTPYLIGSPPLPNYSYSWTPTEGLSNPNIANPTISLENNTDAPIVRQYILKASDMTCPNAPLVKYDTMQVTILPAYNALKIFTGSTTVCPNTSGTKYWVNANPNYDFTWSVSGGMIESGQNTDTIRVAWQGTNSDAWVEVKAKHKIYGCETVFRLPIVVDKLLKPNKPVGESNFCIEPDKVFTYQTSLLNNGSTYLWKTDDNTAIFVSPNNQSAVQIRWATAGIKKVWVMETNQTPCVGSSEILEINVLPTLAPIEIRGASPIPFYAAQVRYEVQASTSSTYQWNLPTGGTITQGHGTHNILIDWEQEGTYLLTVQETNAQGCVGKPTEMLIKVVPFLPPNVITPNGDGKNDTWFLEYIDNFPNHKVQIFDRAGKEVYRSNAYQNNWEAKNLPVDVYFYYLTLHPKIKPIKGSITVIQ